MDGVRSENFPYCVIWRKRLNKNQSPTVKDVKANYHEVIQVAKRQNTNMLFSYFVYTAKLVGRIEWQNIYHSASAHRS